MDYLQTLAKVCLPTGSTASMGALLVLHSTKSARTWKRADVKHLCTFFRACSLYKKTVPTKKGSFFQHCWHPYRVLIQLPHIEL